MALSASEKVGGVCVCGLGRCMCVWACLSVSVGFDNREPAVLVGSNSFTGTARLNPTSSDDRLRVKTWFLS